MEELILEAFASVRRLVDTTTLEQWYISASPRGAEQAVWDSYLFMGFEAGSRKTCLTFFAAGDAVDNVHSSRVMVEGADRLTDDAMVAGCTRSSDVDWLSRFLIRLIEWTINTPGVTWAQIEQELSSGA